MYKGLRLNAISAGVLSVAGALAVNTAFAVEPANFQAGPVYIAPTLDVKTAYVDNLFRSDRAEKSTWMSELTPAIQAWLQNGVNTYSLAYEAVDYRYADSKDDDFTDQQVNLDIHHEFNAKNTLNVLGEYYDGHEERGTGLTDGIGRIIDEPVEYERGTVGGDYTYGNSNSKGRLQLAAKRADYEFQNFRDVTQYRDREQDTVSGTFFWKVGAKTDVLAEVRYLDNVYDETDPENTFGSLDSEEYNYLVGMSWDATAKVAGSAKVGWYDREYDSARRENDDGFQWEVDLTYKPRTYSSIRAETSRFSRETNGLGDSINTEEFKLGWDHSWSSRSSTNVGVRLATEEYSGTGRDDDRVDVDASYNFAAKRWLDLGLGLRREERDSTQSFFDYTRNVYYIEAKLSL
jgi:hypothetical protein